MKQLINFFKDKKVQSVLDVGTGSGDFIPVLKKTFADKEIIGIDPHPDSLKLAQEKYPDVLFKNMTAEKLEFDDDSFDVSSISMALHHLSDVQKSLYEMKRVVKPGGWVIISELYSDNLNESQEVHKLYHHFKSAIDRVQGISHHKTFERNEILNMVKDSGIDIQLHFDFYKDINLIHSTEDSDDRVVKMKQMLEKIKNYPEYEILKPRIEQFRENAEKFGFQPATRVVIVGHVT